MRSYLVVDDNRAFAENLAEILRDEGAEVTVAGSGTEALALVEKTRFDALLCDMRMPEMGGAVVVHKVRRVDPGLPAIVVTAYTRDDDLAAARREGLLAVLPKPVPLPQLFHLLATARRDGLVAVVEDDAQFADNLTEALREHGFATVTAASALEAERVGEVSPFCALVDLRLPGGPDGEALRRLSERFPGMPLVVVTAHAEHQPPVETAGFFTKPFNTAHLLAAVERLHRAR
jgi:CheY-like chemotaxis protein